ncbi:MAG: hypothetical protein ACOY3P_02370, partial [Planctomycetota bacterium]
MNSERRRGSMAWKPFGQAVIYLAWIGLIAAEAARGNAPQQLPAYVTSSWRAEWNSLERSLEARGKQPYVDPRADPHLLDPQALLWPTDRDPLDVELRRAGALLADLKRKPHTASLSQLETELRSIETSAVALDPHDARAARERRALFDRARA